MKLYWIKTNSLIKRLFPGFVWDIPNDKNKIYLTFDDGPVPEATPWVLTILKQHAVKATFFCIGDNIRKHPGIFKRIISEGHSVGNHTFNHLQGWKTPTEDYLESMHKCDAQIYQAGSIKTSLFRPPYGKISRLQMKKIVQMDKKIIMWDILTADYDKNVSPEKCLENAVNKTAPGSIIIFHDSTKAFSNLEYALPKAIEILKGKGFVFDVIR